MNVLSLFDGISCARVALDRAGIEVNAYMASEIEKNAIKVSEKNYPDIIRVGSVVRLEVEGQVDLLIGGSPCTDLSIAKKDRKGLEGDKSCLFWEFVRIKKECNPQWFILENVASMPKADRDIITREMGVEPVMFNASLVSAQCRKRLFWTNIPFDLPADRGILLKDILQPDGEVDERMVVKGKAYCLSATYSHVTTTEAGVKHSIDKKKRTMVKVGHVEPNVQGNRVYSTDGKATALSAEGGGLAGGTTLIKMGRDMGRRLDKDGRRQEGNVDVPITRSLDLRTDDKSNTLTSVTKDNLVVGERVRKLTPIECERLQGLPDNYTEGVATTNRYRCLGNAFNVDVVAHILGRVKLMYSS
jgi:DNA (cytosine-5)-methyltransferase 3A